MAYQKTVWKDQDVENPRTYVMRDNGNNTVTLLDAFGTVTELGTPVNAKNMNKIEQGIVDEEHARSTADTALQAQVNTKANDAGVVHKTGNETIAGQKIFTGDGWITKIQNTDVTYNIAPSSDKGTSIIFTDKNGTQMGCVESMRYQSNDTLVRFNAYSPNGNWASQALELMIDANGNVSAFAPTPNVSSNGTNIATTAFVKAQGYIIDNGTSVTGQNGHMKLSNDIIIQWGIIPGKGTYNFYIPFTSGCIVVLTGTDGSGVNDNNAVTNVTTTNFNASVFGAGGAYWMAIGK